MPQDSNFGSLIGGLAGTFAGPAGSAVGSLVGGLFGGHGTPMGGGEFEGLHNPAYPRLEASSMKGPEAGIYKAYATGLGISVEEVDKLLDLDSDMHGGGHKNEPGGTTDAWRNTNLENARIYLRAYNALHPGAPIIEGSIYNRGAAVGTPSGYGAIVPQQYQQQQYLTPAPAPVPAPSVTQAVPVAGLTLPNVNIQTGGNTPPAAPNYALYGGIGAGALLFLLILVIALKR